MSFRPTKLPIAWVSVVTFPEGAPEIYGLNIHRLMLVTPEYIHEQ
jgi:hypothetical protein